VTIEGLDVVQAAGELGAEEPEELLGEEIEESDGEKR
jgi:hypothetical protein